MTNKSVGKVIKSFDNIPAGKANVIVDNQKDEIKDLEHTWPPLLSEEEIAKLQIQDEAIAASLRNKFNETNRSESKA